MVQVPTVEMFKGDRRAVVNEADRKAWEKDGWKTKGQKSGGRNTESPPDKSGGDDKGSTTKK